MKREALKVKANAESELNVVKPTAGKVVEKADVGTARLKLAGGKETSV